MGKGGNGEPRKRILGDRGCRWEGGDNSDLGKMGSDLPSKALQKGFSDGLNVGVGKMKYQGWRQGFWPEQLEEFGIYPRGCRKS